MSLALNLRALLKLFDISQEAFATTIGVDSATVSRWMNDGSSIRQANVRRICKEFNLKPDDILSEKYGLAAQLAQKELGIYPHSVLLLSPEEAAAAVDAAERAHDGLQTCDDAVPCGEAVAHDRLAALRLPPLDRELAEHSRYVESVWVDIPQSVAEKYPEAFAIEVDNPAAGDETPQAFHAIVDPQKRPEGASLVAVELSGEKRPRIRRWSSYADGDVEDGVKVIGRVVWFQATGML